MTSRRNFLQIAPLVASATILPAIGRTETLPAIPDQAKQLARALAATYGGDWKVSIDRKNEFVLISKTI